MRPALVVIASALAACAGMSTLSTYGVAERHDYGWGYGYQEETTAPGVFRLQYYGFRWQHADQLLGFFRRRATELCGSNNFSVSSRMTPHGPDDLDLLNEDTMSSNAPDRVLEGIVRCGG